MEKSLYINSVELVKFNNIETIPTALFYKDIDNPILESDEECHSNHYTDFNKNFKIELGKVNSTTDVLNRKKFKTSSGQYKSAVELTHDFMKLCLKRTEEWISKQGLTKANQVIIAEPLSFYIQDMGNDWLSNYRHHIRRILDDKFEVIEFLPEPFAVFQYYRYGIRHQLVSKTKIYTAFVVDFGGGTFDTSIIETTKEGDIKKGGKHSKPLAASSQAIGGFLINKLIAQHLLMKALKEKEDKQLLRSVFDNIDKWSDSVFESLNDKKKSAVKWLNELIYTVETPKITLSKLITNWDLNAEINTAIPVEVPINLFDINSKKTQITFTAQEFRDLFVHQVWNNKLKSIIKSALKKAETELAGKPINLMLLSGGSANIQWLKKLIDRDFYNELSNADTISFTEDFQKIVAKGLAVECARKTHEPRSEFASVTYNKLCLVLNPDEKGLEVKRYSLLTEDIVSSNDNDGVLLESAQTLKGFFNNPITWKVRLKHPPKQKLEYYFLRSTLDPNSLQNLYNVDTCVHTDKNTKFDSQILVELTVKEDGTCLPKFIYKRNRDGEAEFYKEGNPFYMDMTYSKDSNMPLGYLGFDFGTSNSSISYISESAIEIITAREKCSSWVEIGDLVEKLPYLISISAKEYLVPRDNDKRIKSALELLEAFFTFFSYLAYAEVCSLKGNSQILKGFLNEKRSIGPLKGFLFKCLDIIGSKAKICKPLFSIKEKHATDIEKIIADLNGFKHDKVEAEIINETKIISIIANICNELMQDKFFGFYENVKKRPFSNKYSGIFRIAHGSKPFFKFVEYTGINSYSEETPYIINPHEGWSLPLVPLIFWSDEESSGKNCYIFDSMNKDSSFSYKIAGEKGAISVSANNYSPLFDILKEFSVKDGKVEVEYGLSFSAAVTD